VTIYRRTDTGTFEPFEETPFSDLEKEKVLEDWIEANPEVLLEGERVAIWGRQPRSEFGKFLDLVGVDESGASVVIELKRGETPRDVIAQTLEYAAWVNSLSLDEMDEIARTYASGLGMEAEGIQDIYRTAFESEEGEEAGEEGSGSRVTFNTHQRMIIVAERFSPEVEQTLRYLRTTHGVDFTGVRFGIHRAGEETLLNVEVVVGREDAIPAAAKAPRRSARQKSDEEILEKVETDFLRRAITALEEWVDEAGIEGLQVVHLRRSDHAINVRGQRVVRWYFAKRWMFFGAPGASAEDADMLRSRLSKPNEVQRTKRGYRFHVATDEDLEVAKSYVLARIGREERR
jgi:hypothetical protein